MTPISSQMAISRFSIKNDKVVCYYSPPLLAFAIPFAVYFQEEGKDETTIRNVLGLIMLEIAWRKTLVGPVICVMIFRDDSIESSSAFFVLIPYTHCYSNRARGIPTEYSLLYLESCLSISLSLNPHHFLLSQFPSLRVCLSLLTVSPRLPFIFCLI